MGDMKQVYTGATYANALRLNPTGKLVIPRCPACNSTRVTARHMYADDGVTLKDTCDYSCNECVWQWTALVVLA